MLAYSLVYFLAFFYSYLAGSCAIHLFLFLFAAAGVWFSLAFLVLFGLSGYLTLVSIVLADPSARSLWVLLRSS